VYALVGMPSMLAAFVKAPLTSILLLFEITRDYNVVLPVMAGVSASMFTQVRSAAHRISVQGRRRLAGHHVVAHGTQWG
jgi:H+/Cl- antiporter ClcA